MKKHLKKTIIWLVCAVMLLSVVACGTEEQPIGEAEPEEIGSTREVTLADAHRTIYMRDRYMGLDLLEATGLLDAFARGALGL